MTTIPSETVIETRHYTDDLFSFRTTRPRSFRFRSGEFAMLGLPKEDGKPLLRAYSIASPNWADDLEFFSIKVPNGPLTSRLAQIKPGDEILLRPKPTGTLVLDALLPGRTLWLVSTGTGIAPFASVARDPETYEQYERVVLTHTCRTQAELQYGIDVVDGIRRDEILSEVVGNRLTHVATVTRETAGPNTLEGRVTDLIRSGELFEATELPAWSPDVDRVMICGSTAMIADTRVLCEAAGLDEGSNSAPGRFVVEKAFVG
ncbi:ferredoxin--NADP reductase [Acuticoccus sp. M5D2P5]|uniref:ferredoxin--NADP reductase n=1 Tax=Acuticoccus kalidii TaxID=2910977 RepID=UPI001F1B0591|nr:ferredoxin--NADP reductase [Acuticoccus kalidii]MCF3932921.1 ferredoxin--NADP reductase [Acuticoccus kalidii]